MIRYPGSKDKIAALLLRSFPPNVTTPLFGQQQRLEYREPFFGGGAVGFRALALLPAPTTVWINDLDYGLVCLWTAVRDDHENLIDQVQRFTPSVDAFYQFKEQDRALFKGVDVTTAGFRKFALHQMSFSGNGAMAGGPIGGREQRSEYNVNCRWRPTRHCVEIQERHRILTGFRRPVRITRKDFTTLIDGAPGHAFVYADPPYFKAGPQLYKHAFGLTDHQRLAASLRNSRAQWVLSYDDQDEIRALYDETWADIREAAITYTTAVARGRRRKNSELIITPRRGREDAA